MPAADVALIYAARSTTSPPCSLPALADALGMNTWTMYMIARGERSLREEDRNELTAIVNGTKILTRFGKDKYQRGPARIRYVIIEQKK